MSLSWESWCPSLQLCAVDHRQGLVSMGNAANIIPTAAINPPLPSTLTLSHDILIQTFHLISHELSTKPLDTFSSLLNTSILPQLHAREAEHVENPTGYKHMEPHSSCQDQSLTSLDPFPYIYHSDTPSISSIRVNRYRPSPAQASRLRSGTGMLVLLCLHFHIYLYIGMFMLNHSLPGGSGASTLCHPQRGFLGRDYTTGLKSHYTEVVGWRLVTHSQNDSRLLGLSLSYSTQMSSSV